MAKSKMYELMLKIGGRTDSSLRSACAAADKNLASLGASAKNAGKVIAGAAVAAAATVGTIGVAAVKAASEYEVQLAKISTLLTGTEAEVAARTSEIGDQILAVSNKTGVVTSDLTDGMYQVISAFGDSTDAIRILETAAKSAAAGGATTTDSITRPETARCITSTTPSTRRPMRGAGPPFTTLEPFSAVSVWTAARQKAMQAIPTRWPPAFASNRRGKFALLCHAIYGGETSV